MGDITDKKQEVPSNVSNFLDTKMSRRDFMKNAFLGALAISNLSLSDSQENVEEEISFKENYPDEITSLSAIKAAVEDFEYKPYTWNSPMHHCSGFVGRYMKHLGFEVLRDDVDPGLYEPDISKPFPEVTTVKQGPYIRKLNESLGGGLVTEVPISEMLSNSTLWEEVPPGTVMYLPEPIGHHGYDTYTHTAVFMGLDKDSKPMFAEFSNYMNNGPEYGHGFDVFSRMYRGRRVKAYLPENEPLKVLMFDAVEASRRYGLEKGCISPNEELFKELSYDVIVTVNINDGTTSLWEMSEKGLAKVGFGEKENIYTIVGRRLKRNNYLSYEYMNDIESQIPFSMYDSASGTHIDRKGVRRSTYTPPFISELSGLEVLNNFGGLGQSTHTDICLLSQLYRDKEGLVALSNKYSAYTLHEVPRGTSNQEILLREPNLKIANTNNIPMENPNLSSGCVNMDGVSWEAFKFTMEDYISNGKKISIMFTTPKIDQRDLIRDGDESSWFYKDDPFGGSIKNWAYSEEDGVGHDNWIYFKRKKEYPRFTRVDIASSSV